MGKATGFLEYERIDGPVVSEAQRVGDFREFHGRLSLEEQKKHIEYFIEKGVDAIVIICIDSDGLADSVKRQRMQV